MKKAALGLILMASATGLSGCNSLLYGVGFREAVNAPQLVDDPKHAATVIWNDARLFGPVPADKLTEGRILCEGMNTATETYKAVGYHHDARAYDGSRLPGGGFYCVKR